MIHLFFYTVFVHKVLLMCKMFRYLTSFDMTDFGLDLWRWGKARGARLSPPPSHKILHIVISNEVRYLLFSVFNATLLTCTI